MDKRKSCLLSRRSVCAWAIGGIAGGVGMLVPSGSSGVELSAHVPAHVSEALRALRPWDGGSAAWPVMRVRQVNTGEVLALPVIRAERSSVRWDAEAFARLDWFFRDWREGVARPIDRNLYALLYFSQMFSQLVYGLPGVVEVTSGYRTQRTNTMLARVYGEAVAEQSYHMRGQAIDFRIPGMSTGLCAAIAWAIGIGGVGRYGERFVHCDTGPRRRWGDPFPG